MEVRKRRTYDAEFKREAARLVVEKGQSCSAVERALGLPSGLVKDWVRALRQDAGTAFPGNGKRRATAGEVERLQQELAVALKERDILKKALGIFSTEPWRYTVS
jgi:transposase